MNHHEHAQQIFAFLLAAHYVTHKSHPLQKDGGVEKLAKESVLFAKAFAEVAEKK